MTSEAQQPTTPDETYDVIVIGGGPVGENAADRASRTGLSVALVEAELVGGECSYWACMPSKTLLRPGPCGPRRGASRASPSATTSTSPPSSRGATRWSRTGTTPARSRGSRARASRSCAASGGSSVRGSWRSSPRSPTPTRTTCRARRLAARHAVIVATGSVPVLPDVPGLADANPWTSREATAVEDVPGSLAIVGGEWSRRRWRSRSPTSGRA